MSLLTSALNWYHEKIGAYDKQLWEKSVDQRILRGVSAVPKKTARIKTELIDVDLVQGSAFAKAKPQHSWIAATVSGIRRVFLLPFFYNWWQQQTNTLVTCMLILLYSLKIAAIYLYFSADDDEFPDVPVSEILTPTAMMFMLGIIHSQIVATFCSKKAPKPITRTKRRKLKSKRMKRRSDYDGESKSSPDSASEDKIQNFRDRHPNQMVQESCDELYIPSFQSVQSDPEKPDSKCQTCDCKRSSRSGQQLRFTFESISKPSCSNEESGLDDPDFIQPSVGYIGNCTKDCKDIEIHNSQETVISNRTAFLNRSISNEESCVSQNSKDSAFSESAKCDCQMDNPIDYVPSFLNVSEATSSEYNLGDKNMPFRKLNSVLNSYCSEANHNFSSDEDLFIAKKSSYATERWMKNSNHIAKTCSKKYSIKRDRFTYRRYSDVEPHYRNNSYLENHRHSFDSVIENKNAHCTNFLSSTSLLSDNQNISQTCDNSCDRSGAYRRNFPREIKMPINIKKISSSGESCADTTTPNTPKPQTSDLEWPLITDCQSDCTDYSSQCSDSNGSDISPSENPFAWEIREVR
ncbi:uncharacterized protein LOC118203845, partial [Stegodyphus dumicola]|uniref:uncharacterized protein LOC118203845 n=1 Tax=Stegodyphus dumicola TaxID=202533 RepID=UPI0015AE26E4